MIDANEIFSNNDKRIAIWCDSVEDTNDLAVMAENIIETGVDLISVPTSIVSDMWVHLEKKPVKIMTRCDFTANHKNIDFDISELAKNIKSAFVHGADGVQIFIKMSNFEDFIEKISLVRDDLFFNKEFCLAFDIEDIDIYHWNDIFQKINSINVNTLMFSLNEDTGTRSDFVGRIYGMLKNWNFNGDLHFALNNNYDRIDQVVRLIESEKPELHDKVKFFLEY